MSLDLILVFAAAVLAILFGQIVRGPAEIANGLALILFAIFAVRLRWLGLRKPVV